VVYVVDTVQVDAEGADEYLRIVETVGVPVMNKAGARFVSCWSTRKDLGEPVEVKTIWAFEDHVEWNEIRKNMVLSPGWFEYSDKISALWTGGNRRFYYPAGFSPMQ
jgi:NIPSNAP protein